MKTKRILCLLLTLTLLFSTIGFTAFAKNAESVVVKENEKSSIAATSSLKAHDIYLEKLMSTYSISGVAYVTQDRRVLAQHSSGMKNVAGNENISVDTLFPIGSVSKQFCAAAVLLLQEDGKLSVYDTLEKYFPEYEIGKDITIHNLLNMRSGIRDHVNFDEEYIGHEIPLEQYTVSPTATYKENQKAITDWLFTQELKFLPNEEYSYSNANFLLLSMIVEKVSGVKYSDFIKQNIFTPLNMTNSGFYEELAEHPELARHYLDEGTIPFDPYHHGISQGSGDLVSNAPDMDKWLTALTNGSLLSEESYKAMTTMHSPDSYYCYGIFADPTNNALYHQGDITTYQSFALTIPEKNLNIFVVTNDINTVSNKNYYMQAFAYTILKKFTNKTIIGDVDNDKEISIMDATSIQMHIAQIKTLTSRQLKCSDTDGDGETTIIDATEIQRFLARK